MIEQRQDGSQMKESIEKARSNWEIKHGKCSLCAVGYEPFNGMHGKHFCGNIKTCALCHNAGMRYLDQCAACGRIETDKHK